MKGLGIRSNKQKGFTLIELTIVMAIIAVLAAVVFPTVTGLTSRSRSSGQTQDMNTVQNAANTYQSESSTSKWPTSASDAAIGTTGALASSTWSAGSLPTGTGPTGSGTLASPYTFSAIDIAEINFTASTTVSGSTKTFYSDYLKSLPGRSTDTITVAGSGTSSTFKVKKQGSEVWIKISNNATGSIDFNAWTLDPKGNVWVFVDQDSY